MISLREETEREKAKMEKKKGINFLLRFKKTKKI